MYEMLGEGTDGETFSTEETYSAVGYGDQSDFFREVCKRAAVRSRSDDVMKNVIRCCCNGKNDAGNENGITHMGMLEVFQGDEELEQIYRLAVDEFEQIKKKHKRYKKARFSVTGSDEIVDDEMYKSWMWFIAFLTGRFKSYTEAFEFILKIMPKTRNDDSLHYLLVCYPPSDEEWIKVYDLAVEHGIQPCEELQEKYAEIKRRP